MLRLVVGPHHHFVKMWLLVNRPRVHAILSCCHAAALNWAMSVFGQGRRTRVTIWSSTSLVIDRIFTRGEF